MTSQPATIRVNEDEFVLGEIAHALDLVQSLGLNPLQIAVEVDGQIVAAKALEQKKLFGGEQIEIVTLMGGG